MKKVKTVKVSAKCSDLCFVELLDDEGKVIAQRDGYVPDFMPGNHYGDYVELEIDPNTGIITNWDNAVTPKQMIRDLKED